MATSGTSSTRPLNGSSMLPPMNASSRPASIIARPATCGPPCTMVTSSPQAA